MLSVASLILPALLLTLAFPGLAGAGAEPPVWLDEADAAHCGDPDKLWPLYPPDHRPFAALRLPEGKILPTHTTMVVFQAPDVWHPSISVSGMWVYLREEGTSIWATGWAGGGDYVLEEPCLCQLWERWPAYVRWEVWNPCVGTS